MNWFGSYIYRLILYVRQKYGLLVLCLLVSVGLHLVILFGFGSYTLFRYYFKRDVQFDALPFQKKNVKLRSISHKIQLQRNPKQVRVIRRISIDRMSKVALPTVPKKEKLTRKFEVSKSFLTADANFDKYSELDIESGLFGTVKRLDHAFEGKVYRLDRNTSELPRRWPSSRLIGTIYTRKIDVPITLNTRGFPGLTNLHRDYGIVYVGKFYVRNPGKYTFLLDTDDGSCLRVDGNKLCEFTAIRSSSRFGFMRAEKYLDEGPHTIKLEFFQGFHANCQCQLWLIKPGSTESNAFDMLDFLPPRGQNFD